MPSLKKAIEELRKLNKDFQMLSTPLYNNLKALQAKKYKVSIPHHTEELEKCKLVGKISRLFHGALRQVCTVDSQHGAHLCVQVDEFALEKSQSAKIKSKVAFHCVHQLEPRFMWLSIESILEELKTIKRKLETSVSQTHEHVIKKTLVSTFLDSRVNPPTNRMKELKIEWDPKQNISKFLCQGSQAPFPEDMILRTTEDLTKCIHVIRPVMPLCSRPLQTTSLQQLISYSQGRPRLEQFLMSERIGLARVLAVGMLQYHSTPLLSKPWKSGDILFLGLEDEVNDDVQTLTAPHVKAYIDSNDPSDHRNLESTELSSPATITGNPLLFNLGVIFLEIAFMSPWQALRRDSATVRSSDQ